MLMDTRRIFRWTGLPLRLQADRTHWPTRRGLWRSASAWHASSRKRDDDSNLQVWLGNQALILQAWGKLDEALELLKKQEEICLALGDQDWLQHSYGNQAGIFLIRGRLDESIDLYKKQEEICLVLGSQDGLQRSYAGQALILKALGRVDEAFALHKKEEEICLALGKRSSSKWGRLDEALALLKKQEEICLALGNGDSLQRSYGKPGAHPQRLGAARRRLGPSTRNKKRSASPSATKIVYSAVTATRRSYLKTGGGSTKPSLFTRKRKRSASPSATSQTSATCHCGLGSASNALFNHPQAERDRLSAALAIFEELKMPRERDEVKAELEEALTAGAS